MQSALVVFVGLVVGLLVVLSIHEMPQVRMSVATMAVTECATNETNWVFVPVSDTRCEWVHDEEVTAGVEWVP